MKKIHRIQFEVEAAQSEALNALDTAALLPVGSKQEVITQANAALNRRDKMLSCLARISRKQHEMEKRGLLLNKRFE